MALDGDQLGQEMYDAVRAVGNGDTEADALARMKALGAAIVDHIKTNGTIGMLTTQPGGSPPHTHTTIPESGKIS